MNAFSAAANAASEAEDEALLDAYSRSVAHVAAKLGPATAKIEVRGRQGATRSESRGSGLREGDLILACNERVVRDADDLHRALSEEGIERGVVLSLLRGKCKLQISLRPRID